MVDYIGDGAKPRHPAHFRIWHLWLASAFVAFAIVNIQDQRRSEPELIALAGVGFLGYALLGWFGWLLMRPLERRLGRLGLLVVYMIAMALLFVGLTIVYLVMESYHPTALRFGRGFFR